MAKWTENRYRADITEAEVAWVAGVIEGEGWFGYQNGIGRVTVAGTDLDILERLQKVTGCGKVCGPYWHKNSRRPFYNWNVHRAEEGRALMEAVLPWLGERRAAKVREVLSSLR